MKNEWMMQLGINLPTDLTGNDRVMVKKTHEGDAIGPIMASIVDWSKIVAYRRVVESGDVENLRARLNDLANENAALRARPTAEDLARLQTLNDELVAHGATMRQRSHDLAMAQMEHIAATHAGIKRGIEIGDLPPDYYGRFGTVWAPAK